MIRLCGSRMRFWMISGAVTRLRRVADVFHPHALFFARLEAVFLVEVDRLVVELFAVELLAVVFFAAALFLVVEVLRVVLAVRFVRVVLFFAVLVVLRVRRVVRLRGP